MYIYIIIILIKNIKIKNNDIIKNNIEKLIF